MGGSVYVYLWFLCNRLLHMPAAASSSSSGSILGKAFKKLTKSKTMPSNTADSVPHETSMSPVR